jgi:transposase-like protein
MRQEDRMVQHRLAWFRHAEEVTRNVAKTCRYFGISRTRYYHWYNRYRETGLEGLRDRSRRPMSVPARPPGTSSTGSCTSVATTTSGLPRSRCTSRAIMAFT